MTKKHLIFHGHFYQPPRENPWTGEIDTEFSAAPFHDWNERILQECYKPNTEAVIVDAHGDIKRRVNNFEYINFNFGPTLFHWIRKKHPKTYDRIIEADRKSIWGNNGHGNAIAQVYNHIIMPLAIERDKITQVRWGVKDFEFHFGRNPSGMWLAETACNDATLKVLADEKIRYTILDPSQALAIRKIGSDDWIKKPDLKLDTSVPYRFYTDENKSSFVDIFFFNDTISSEIAFGDTIFHADNLMERIAEICNEKSMISAATDGETFGHHKHFADRTIAYLFSELSKQNGFVVTNYSNYLEMSPPEYEVLIDNGPHEEGTSWSCSHGVGRWNADCGCQTGGEEGWNQGWRKPLRESLNYLREELDKIFEDRTSDHLKDVWEARNNYIEVILNPRPEAVEKFFYFNSKKYLDPVESELCLKMLEMQKDRLLMFTSCGWFFSDISNIETIQILKYAAKAIEIAREFAGEDVEERFQEYLSEVKGNKEKLPTAADIYQKKIKPLSKTKFNLRIM